MFRSILIILGELLNINKTYIKCSWFIKYIKICLQNVCNDIRKIRFYRFSHKKISILLTWTVVKIYGTTTSASMNQFYTTANEFYNIWRHFIHKISYREQVVYVCICTLMILSNILRILDRNAWSSDKLCIKILF